MFPKFPWIYPCHAEVTDFPGLFLSMVNRLADSFKVRYSLQFPYVQMRDPRKLPTTPRHCSWTFYGSHWLCLTKTYSLRRSSRSRRDRVAEICLTKQTTSDIPTILKKRISRKIIRKKQKHERAKRKGFNNESNLGLVGPLGSGVVIISTLRMDVWGCVHMCVYVCECASLCVYPHVLMHI